MTIRVGRIPYLDCEPFYIDMENRGIQLCDMVPSALGAAATRGEIDAGPLPLVDCFLLEDRFRPVASFCVAATEKARSTLLYSKRPIQELTGARIGIASETSTAFRLLQVLLGLKYQVRPEAYVTLQEPNDACLFIGNEALRRRRGLPDYPHRYDLGDEWHQWTGLPFVFARWMARKDLDPKDMLLLEGALFVGLEDGVDAMYHLAEPRKELLMRPRDVVEYIRGFRYYIGVSEQKAIDLFRKYLDRLNSQPA